MHIRSLLSHSLRFYWRTNLAVVLGVMVATAVIGGALVVGDSVRESLRTMSLERLGGIDHAISGGRFFREDLAEELKDDDWFTAPAILMQGTLEREFSVKSGDDEERQTLRASQVQVVALDQRLWEMLEAKSLTAPEAGEVVINQRVADQLQASVGDDLSIVIEIPASIPRDSLLGDRDETITEVVATITAIVPEEQGLARFGMNPSQQIPANVFINLKDLQIQTELAAVPQSRRNPVAKPGRVNALFFSSQSNNLQSSIAPSAADQLTQRVAEKLKLEDLALRIVQNSKHGYLSLESEQMILENSLSEKALATANDLNCSVSPVLVYLLNEIWNSADPEKYSMYSIIAGIDPQLPAPFGPFEFVGEHSQLDKGKVYLNDWLAQDLDVQSGQSIRVKYHEVGDRGELPELEASFDVAGVVRLTGVADDTGFTPDVPGVTDAKTYGEWRQPFPLKEERITDRDDLYWDNTETDREDDYRTTPKVFTSLETAKDLWKSRYGELTSVRFASTSGESLDKLQQRFETEFLKSLEPTQTGLVVQPIKAAGLQAAQGTTDFTGLFIGFSFFLILAATILVSLLFRLGIETRLSELGLLVAIGLSPKSVRRLFLVEGALLVAIGGILGCFAAVGYATIMVYGLKTWWIGAIGTRFLEVTINPISLSIGFIIAAVVAVLAIYWALRETRQESTRDLLSGQSAAKSNATKLQNRRSRNFAIATLAGSIILMLLTLVGIIPDVEAFGGFSWKIVMFFLVGIGLLTGGLSLLSAVLGSNDTMKIEDAGTASRVKLGLRNAARNRQRSVLTTSLISSATFVIVAVAAGQQNPAGEEPQIDSGNGGFTLIAETNVPVLNDVNTEEGRSKLGFDVLDTEQMQTLDQAHVVPFRVKPGENASCLNLYQTKLPTVLGVPDKVLQEFISSNRFAFADTPGEHPWELLQGTSPDGDIPVLGDMNTLMYSLHKGIGSTISVPDDTNPKHTLKVSGMFANSVFQGVLVMSESNFKQVFPDQVGYQYFLVETPLANADQVAATLESGLGDYGFDAERVSDRLTDFLAVQNTYLSTFQTLGGLGLLLGTIGLATVMLRNVLERRSELALMRAIGFGKSQLGMMVVYENAFLLVCGLVLGTISALLAMAPHLSSSVSEIPWKSLSFLLIAVFGVGMISVTAAVRTAVKTPILSTLRGE